MTEIQDELPDGWAYVPTADVGTWHNPETNLWVRVEHVEDGGAERYIVALERTVRADGFEADIETYATSARTLEEAVDAVIEITHEAEDVVTAIRAERVAPNGGDEKPFVQFHCVWDTRLPDGISIDDLHYGTDEGEVPESIVEAGEDAEADLRVDIYPVHVSEVRGIGGDADE